MKFEDAVKLMREGKSCTFGDGYIKYRMTPEGKLYCTRPEESKGFWHYLQADWREVQETHDFAWAREQLKQGKNFKRLSGRSCFAVAADAYAFSLEDIDATDWVLA
jgi:hypothetical protein